MLPPSRYGLSGVALRRVTVAIGLFSVRLTDGSYPAGGMGEDLHFTERNRRRGQVRLHCLGSNLAQPLHCRASSPSVFLFRHHPYKPCCTTASRVTASWHSLQITHCCSRVQVYCKHPAYRWCAYHADSAAPGSWAAYHRSFARPGHSDQLRWHLPISHAFEPPFVPRWRQAARILGTGHIVERCTGVASSYARWTSALAGAPFSRENAGFGDRGFTLNYAPTCKPHAGLAPTHTYQVTPICHMAVAMRHVKPAFQPAVGPYLAATRRMRSHPCSVQVPYCLGGNYMLKELVEQAKGIEPSFSAWKADVFAVIRCLLNLY